MTRKKSEIAKMEKREFARRRKRLMDRAESGSIIIQPNAPEKIRNRDVYYPYRADSDFYYLTGFPEPESLMVLLPDREEGEYILFCRENDPEQETWHGTRAGLEGACKHYGADDAFPIGDLDEILPGLLENRERIYYTMGRYVDFDQRLIGWLNRVNDKGRAGIHAPDKFVSLGHLVHEMRLFKSSLEQKAMRKAAAITSDGHKRAMKFTRPGVREFEIEAELLHSFMLGGARAVAYPSIVGGGGNSCTLHYVENSSVLRDGDILLIDAGAEYDYYAADVTRTFPVNGSFTKEQRDVYKIVLEAQEAAIEQVQPGNTWNMPHDAAVEVITQGLVSLGVLEGHLSKLVSSEAYRPYYMHKTGHWLGMDVHDVGDYSVAEEWRVFEPGMVTTIEPGLYFAEGLGSLNPKWWNIGVRIEDDVLVTEKGHDVLTDGVPKQVEEVEAAMQGYVAV